MSLLAKILTSFLETEKNAIFVTRHILPYFLGTKFFNVLYFNQIFSKMYKILFLPSTNTFSQGKATLVTSCWISLSIWYITSKRNITLRKYPFLIFLEKMQTVRFWDFEVPYLQDKLMKMNNFFLLKYFEPLKTKTENIIITGSVPKVIHVPHYFSHHTPLIWIAVEVWFNTTKILTFEKAFWGFIGTSHALFIYLLHQVW